MNVMRLAELSAAERDYLTSPLPLETALSPLLVRHFSRVLGARMKQPVQVKTGALPGQEADFLIDTDAPVIVWDSALEAMWLRGRLGGRSGAPRASCSAMTRSLQRTLQLGLAETWISAPGTEIQPKTLPTVLSLRVEIQTDKISGVPAGLVIRFPRVLASMNRWADYIIGHAN